MSEGWEGNEGDEGDQTRPQWAPQSGGERPDWLYPSHLNVKRENESSIGKGGLAACSSSLAQTHSA